VLIANIPPIRYILDFSLDDKFYVYTNFSRKFTYLERHNDFARTKRKFEFYIKKISQQVRIVFYIEIVGEILSLFGDIIHILEIAINYRKRVYRNYILPFL